MICELSCFFRIYSVNDDDVTFVLGPIVSSLLQQEVRCLQWFLHRSMYPLLYWLATSHASIKIAPE